MFSDSPWPRLSMDGHTTRECTHPHCGTVCSEPAYAAEGAALERRDLRQWAAEQAIQIYAGEGMAVSADDICALADRLLQYVREEDDHAAP